AVDAGLHRLDSAEVPFQAKALLQRLPAKLEAHPVAGALHAIPLRQKVRVPTRRGPVESDRTLNARAGRKAREEDAQARQLAVELAMEDRLPALGVRRRAPSLSSQVAPLAGVASEIVQLDTAQAMQVLGPEIGFEVVGRRVGGAGI